MIEFETNVSPFFVANKEYSDKIVNQLSIYDFEFSGYCNSSSYEIQAALKKDNLNYSLTFKKVQNTQNGVIIPADSTEYFGVEAVVDGLEKSERISLGKSTLNRNFVSKEIKNILPSPYYLKSAKPFSIEKLEKLVEIVLELSISKLEIKNGKLKIKIHNSQMEALEFYHKLNKIIELLKN